jgi:lipopolysaccharide assembly protein A
MTSDPAYARPGDDQPGGQPAPGTVPPGEAYPAGAPEPTAPAAPLPPQHTIERTRTGGLWVAAISAAVVILLLLIFILQNGEQVEVSLFGANPDLPLGVALLLAAVLGALGVALVGVARVVQLRMVAKRHRAEDRATRR